MPFKNCNWVDGFFRNNYTLFKNFTVFFKPTQKSFTRQNYGVYLGYFLICSTKLTLSCNDHLVKVKYSEEYKVFSNFSLSYHKKHYDYRKYRLRYRAFELCATHVSKVQAIWKTGNSWMKGIKSAFCPSMFKTINRYYVVGKQFNVFLVGFAQSFDKYEYQLYNGRLTICAEKLKPATVKSTEEDLLLCKDSLIKIKFDDEYKVWNNFSMLFKNKVYDYNKYRVLDLDDGINICNSTDNYVRPFKHCNWLNGLFRNNYTLFKNFTVFFKPTQQSFTRQNYGVYLGYFLICSTI